ncbi:MAG: hypothetical protein KFH87_06675 [Bacteroidetes bacterium]|nr:hypothetical protein [Bacteroidota bacterium]
MSTSEISLSTRRDCHLTLFHDTDDPLSWILRRWKRGFLGRRSAEVLWFSTREQAEDYARQLVRECEGGPRVAV